MEVMGKDLKKGKRSLKGCEPCLFCFPMMREKLAPKTKFALWTAEPRGTEMLTSFWDTGSFNSGVDKMESNIIIVG